MDVLGIIGVATGSVSIPLSAASLSTAVVGISQGASAQQGGGGKAASEPDADDPRLAKFSLRTTCTSNSSRRDNVHGKIVVLRNRKLYLDDSDPAHRNFQDGHPFAGFYLDYPAGAKPLGLVSTISVEPPELNWIYVDSATLEVKYGNKTQSVQHIPGPWDWTDDRQALTLEGWEGFVALEESPGVWALCYDRNDDHLRGIARGRRVLECVLERRVLKQ